jgi:GGDEF domain-containing protein
VVLADAASLDAGVEVLAERLLEVVQEPFHLSDGDVPASVQASIGIALAVGGTAEALLFNADTALYRAKRAGKSCFRVFDATMSQRRD